MLFYYLTQLLLIVLKLIIAEQHRLVSNNHDNIISISSVLGIPIPDDFLSLFIDKIKMLDAAGSSPSKQTDVNSLKR
jgi:hypothetical protein